MIDPTRHRQLEELNMVELCTRIFRNSRNELYLNMRYLDLSLSSLGFEADPGCRGVGTDGFVIYYHPDYVCDLYKRGRVHVNRAYLHMVLHCLFCHMDTRGKREPELWNLACDIAVEQIISREKIPILETGGDAKKIREKVFHILGDRSDSAEKICRKLKEQAFPFHLEELEEAFHFDDHTLWDTCTGEKGKRTKEKWNKLLSYTAANRQDHRKRRGSQKGDQKEEAGTVRSGRYDYKKFLRQFSVLREEVELDTESFDYIFYNYGMEHYGNLPLIEPLEYKEVNRLEELVIAIDTSGSCDGETVRRFLGETYSILSEKENFFHKMKVYLIQCDCCIQDVKVIHSEEEWKEYSKNITIQGRGGTDFRPVFRYVKEQQEKKEIRSLKALIYFTDGDGIYPGSKPDYETAFVFLHKTQKMELVPPWAIRLVAEQEGVRYRT